MNKIAFKLMISLTVLLFVNTALIAETSYKAITTKTSYTTDEQFAIMIGHLNKEKLFVEADAWLKLLESAAEDVAVARLDVKKQTQKIKVEEEKTEALKEKSEALEDKTEELEEKTEILEKKTEAVKEKVEAQKEKAQEKTQKINTDDEKAKAEVVETIKKEEKEVKKEAAKVKKEVAKEEKKVKKEAAKIAKEAAKVEATVKKLEEVKEVIKKKKLSSLENITKLREKRTAISDKLNLILLEINERIGTNKDGTELDKVLVYRRYMNSVGGVAIDVSDSTSALVNITGWLVSDQGGIRWLINIVTFILIILAAMVVSFLLKNAIKKAFDVSGSKSQLLSDFISNIVSKIVMLWGILIALSALEVNVGPIMAIVGAAGFVIAFALQGTLSNFASGIMMMLYRPFDIGDVVEVAGILGKVKSMNLVSTTIMTADNRSMLIPNNSIWGDVITNITSSGTRRVDMIFGIGYGDDMAKAQEIIERILEQHPLVLETPEPTVKVHELADSSVNFICRPWVKTEDYWTTYWEITRAVKECFDNEGVSIPFPQSDIHIIKETQIVHQKTMEEAVENFTSKGAKKASSGNGDSEA